MAPKLIAEFGVLGVGLLLVYLFYFFKNFRWFRSMIMGRVALRDRRQIFFNSCFLMYGVDFFVRGAGYFSAEGFMFIASIIWMLLGEKIVKGGVAVRNKSGKSARHDGTIISRANI